MKGERCRCRGRRTFAGENRLPSFEAFFHLPRKSNGRIMRYTFIEYLTLGVIPYMARYDDINPTCPSLSVVWEDGKVGSSVSNGWVERGYGEVR